MGQLLMRLKNLDNIPDTPLPDGLSVETAGENAAREWEWIVNSAFQEKYSFDMMTGDAECEYRPERVLFARCFGQSAATASAYRRNEYPGEGYLHMVATHPWYQGQGAGRAVVLEALRQFRREGLNSVVLSTDDFRLNAVALYKSVGFEPIVQDGDQEMKARWEKVDEANTFYIYRRTSSTEWENIGAVSYAYYFVDQEASEGEVYEYAVRASSQGYYSASYDSKKITCIRTLDKVELGSFSNTEYGVRLTWEAVPGADSYQISRRTIDGEWEVIAPSVRRTVFTDTDVENGERYYYAVRGVNGMVVSTEATTSRWIIYRRNNQLPDVNLGTFYNTAVGPRIMWDAVGDAKRYRVYRRTEQSDWKLLSSSVTGTQYVDKTAEPYTTYYYTVRAVNGNVISAGYDAEKKIKCVKSLQNVALGKYTNTSDGVQITWTGVGDAKRYRVYRKVKGGEWVMLNNSVTGTSYLDKTAQADTIYYYTVRAVNGEVISPGYDSSRWIMCRR